ncbi:hypothetical protein SAY86_001085 [Trapa natans]|uniref:Bifunctional inhibitor/plant lipid transfer protein/seed storage helical domain-containing protein n=1 Tax=Trapa natans TaxID=22666 RepID=A0AAN7MQF1_TRANT|nr:hypothetical protein SAY86_001085 [Trapa natans]
MVSVKLVVAAFVVAALVAAVAEGQSTPSYALEPCVKYVNAMSTPSEACCSPTREMVANEKDSLFTQTCLFLYAPPCWLLLVAIPYIQPFSTHLNPCLHGHIWFLALDLRVDLGSDFG